MLVLRYLIGDGSRMQVQIIYIVIVPVIGISMPEDNRTALEGGTQFIHNMW